MHRTSPHTLSSLLGPVVATALTLGLPWTGEAVTITQQDLPQAIQNAIVSGATIGLTSGVDLDGMSAFIYQPVGADPAFLLRYTLAPGSRQVASVDDGTGNWSTTTTDLGGYLWMEAPLPQLLSDPQHFILYTDKVTPTPDNLWIGANAGDPLHFALPAADVLNQGGGSMVAGLDFNNNPYSAGTLQTFDPGLFPCVAEGCEVSADLNLIYHDYTSGSLFDAADARSLLYRQNYHDPLSAGGQDITQYYYIHPVPEPVSLLTVATAGTCLAWWRRRRAD